MGFTQGCDLTGAGFNVMIAPGAVGAHSLGHLIAKRGACFSKAGVKCPVLPGELLCACSKDTRSALMCNSNWGDVVKMPQRDLAVLMWTGWRLGRRENSSESSWKRGDQGSAGIDGICGCCDGYWGVEGARV